MLDTIIAFDHSLFMLLNSVWTFDFLDWFMPFITNAKTWMPIILVVWFYLLFAGDKKMRFLALALLVSVGCNDLICARVIKKSVGRKRPCSLEETDTFKCRLLLPRKSSKSFPSNHASNTAAFAATVLFFWGFKAGIPFVFLALIIGYSRIYCGVHFPLDVLTGWAIGTLFGWAGVKLVFRFYQPAPESQETVWPSAKDAETEARTESLADS
jgi:undecaprenyl-diphosphatase